MLEFHSEKEIEGYSSHVTMRKTGSGCAGEQYCDYAVDTESMKILKLGNSLSGTEPSAMGLLKQILSTLRISLTRNQMKS